MAYITLLIIVIVIIIIIALIIFGVNASKTSKCHSNDNLSDAAKRNSRGLIIAIDEGDRTFCKKTYEDDKNVVTLEYTFCIKDPYNANYTVRNVAFDQHRWKGTANVVISGENDETYRSYIDYDDDDCTYNLTIIDINGNLVRFNNPSRSISITTKLKKVCARKDSVSSFSSTGSSDVTSTNSCEQTDTNSSERSNASSSGQSSTNLDQSDKNGSEDNESTCNDDVDPYESTSHCNESVSFYPDSQNCSSENN